MTHRSEAAEIVSAPQRTILLGAPALPVLKGSSGYKVVAAFADQESRTGAPVLGKLADAAADLAEALREAEADCVLWAAPPRSRALARAVLAVCASEGRPVLIAEGGVIRPLNLEDLFPHSDGAPDQAIVSAAFVGKRILVTGGAGSIGGQILRRLAGVSVARLVAVDISEVGVFTLQSDPALARAPFAAVLCDISDAEELRAVMLREKPDIVFHTAALKHVPIAEAHPSRAVKMNVLGTRNVAEACASVGADLVFVSTDKAVHPKSVMGATKRLGALYCRALDSFGPGKMRRIVVRLGNVLGSAGSVSTLFERQLAGGGPITITHPNAERFFVTIDQAADSLLQAAASGLAPRAARGLCFVPKMGEAIAIVDLAHDIIRLAGLRPGEDVAIKVVGLRAGEKLTETLIGEEEEELADSDVRAIRSALPSVAELEAHIARLIAAARAGDDATVKRALEAAVSYRRPPARLVG